MRTISASDFFKNFNQAIQIEPRVPQANYPEHNHRDFSEIVIVSSGKGRHILNGYPQDLYAGVVFYVQEQDCHLYEEVDNLYLTNLLIRPQKFRFLQKLSPVLEKLKPQKSSYQLIGRKTLERIGNHLNILLEQEGGQDKLQEECLFMQILSDVEKNQFKIMGVGSTDERGYQILLYLAKNFAQNIDWSELSSKFAMSLRTLNRFFKNKVGISPQNYLNKLRLSYAYERILTSDASITEIALNSGFNDSAYFSSCFKQEYQKSPQELRVKK